MQNLGSDWRFHTRNIETVLTVVRYEKKCQNILEDLFLIGGTCVPDVFLHIHGMDGLYAVVFGT